MPVQIAGLYFDQGEIDSLGAFAKAVLSNQLRRRVDGKVAPAPIAYETFFQFLRDSGLHLVLRDVFLGSETLFNEMMDQIIVEADVMIKRIIELSAFSEKDALIVAILNSAGPLHRDVLRDIRDSDPELGLPMARTRAARLLARTPKISMCAQPAFSSEGTSGDETPRRANTPQRQL